jgi:hypothetical protein
MQGERRKIRKRIHRSEKNLCASCKHPISNSDSSSSSSEECIVKIAVCPDTPNKPDDEDVVIPEVVVAEPEVAVAEPEPEVAIEVAISEPEPKVAIEVAIAEPESEVANEVVIAEPEVAISEPEPEVSTEVAIEVAIAEPEVAVGIAVGIAIEEPEVNSPVQNVDTMEEESTSNVREPAVEKDELALMEPPEIISCSSEECVACPRQPETPPPMIKLTKDSLNNLPNFTTALPQIKTSSEASNRVAAMSTIELSGGCANLKDLERWKRMLEKRK